MDVKTKPWLTPNFIIADMPSGREGPKWGLAECSAEDLAKQCDDFRADVFRKAGKADPALEPRCPKNALSDGHKECLRVAAEVVLEKGFTSQALHAAVGEFYSGLSVELLNPRRTRHNVKHYLISQFRLVFASPTSWPDGDQETRCLALLLLIEFLQD